MTTCSMCSCGTTTVVLLASCVIWSADVIWRADEAPTTTAPATIDFESDALGRMPANFTAGLTAACVPRPTA